MEAVKTSKLTEEELRILIGVLDLMKMDKNTVTLQEAKIILFHPGITRDFYSQHMLQGLKYMYENMCKQEGSLARKHQEEMEKRILFLTRDILSRVNGTIEQIKIKLNLQKTLGDYEGTGN